LEVAFKGWDRWLNGRIAGEWLEKEEEKVNAPSFGERMSQMFLGSRAKRK
jgi:hypothetical protein